MFEVPACLVRTVSRMRPDGTMADERARHLGMRALGLDEPKTGGLDAVDVFQADWIEALVRRRRPTCPPRPLPPRPRARAEVETDDERRARWLRRTGAALHIAQVAPGCLWLANLLRVEDDDDRPMLAEWGNDEGEVVSRIVEKRTASLPSLHRLVFYDTRWCPDGVCINRFDRATFEMMAKALGAPNIASLLEGLEAVSEGLLLRWPAPPRSPGTICMHNLRPCSRWVYAVQKDAAPEAATPEMQYEFRNDTCVFPGTIYPCTPRPALSMLSSDRQEVTVVLDAAEAIPGSVALSFREDWHGIDIPCTKRTVSDGKTYATLRAPMGYVFSF